MSTPDEFLRTQEQTRYRLGRDEASVVEQKTILGTLWSVYLNGLAPDSRTKNGRRAQRSFSQRYEAELIAYDMLVEVHELESRENDSKALAAVKKILTTELATTVQTHDDRARRALVREISKAILDAGA